MEASTMRSWLPCAMSFAFLLAAPATAEAQDSEKKEETEQKDEGESKEQQAQSSEGQLQRSDRMEFDARLIRGERASGAVFLFQRTPRKLPSMVERRRTYLEGSVRSTLGNDWAKSFEQKRERAQKETDTGDDDADEQKEGDIIERLAEESRSDD